MDRSFLSQAAVIEASRRFVCVRLATYENKEEGAFLKAFNVTRSGDLENSVFTILAPDGKRQLARAARSTRQTFTDAARMAETMNRIAGQIEAQPAEGQAAELPKVANLRLAINIAACDNRPLVVVFAEEAKDRQSLEKQLAQLAGTSAFLGQFVYALASTKQDLALIENAKGTSGVLLVQPDPFGRKGKVLTQADVKATSEELTSSLKNGLRQYQAQEKTFRGHVQEGHQKGVFWETVLPVTDPMEQRARERGRSSGPSPR